MFGHYLDAFGLGNLAMRYECIAEVGIVEGLGIDHTDAVELLIRGVDGDTVGGVVHARDVIEFFGDDSSAPSEGDALLITIIIIELELIGLDGCDH